MKNATLSNKARQVETVQETKVESLIQIDEFEAFEPTMECELTTTRQLMQKVNSIFGTVFDDYIGCTILPAMQLPEQQVTSVPVYDVNGWDVKLYFARNRRMSDDSVTALEFYREKETNRTSSSIVNNMYRIGSLSKVTKLYNLTDEAKATLADYFHVSALGKNGQPNWDQFAYEVQTAPNGPVQVVVAGLDIVKIIGGLIKGNKDPETGDPIQYQIIPISPVSVGATSNWKVQIAKMNVKGIRKAEREFGMFNANPAVMPLCPVR